MRRLGFISWVAGVFGLAVAKPVLAFVPKSGRTPIRHTKCGKVMAYYLAAEPRKPDILRSEDFERLDGSHPQKCAVFSEQCPHCKERIFSPMQMRRCFDEAV